MNQDSKNKLIIFVFFLASMISLNTIPSSLPSHTLGIAFIIATVYCIIAVYKGKNIL